MSVLPSPKSPSVDPDEISRSINLLFKPGDVVEVRLLNTRAGTISGYFSDFEKLKAAIVAADRYQSSTYWTLNTLDPRLLGRACNRLRERLKDREPTTGDTEVIRRRWLPVDLDPVRPSGIGSSDQEHQAAIERAEFIAADAQNTLGRPTLLASSGSGAHLLYPIDFPNDARSTELVQTILNALHAKYSDGEVEVDTGVFNASRVWKIYGTVSRKGDLDHRTARVLQVWEN